MSGFYESRRSEYLQGANRRLEGEYGLSFFLVEDRVRCRKGATFNLKLKFNDVPQVVEFDILLAQPRKRLRRAVAAVEQHGLLGVLLDPETYLWESIRDGIVFGLEPAQWLLEPVLSRVAPEVWAQAVEGVRADAKELGRAC